MAAMGNAAKRPRRLARTREDMESPGERLPCRPARLKDSCTAMESCERPDSAPPEEKAFWVTGPCPPFSDWQRRIVRDKESGEGREPGDRPRTLGTARRSLVRGEVLRADGAPGL